MFSVSRLITLPIPRSVIVVKEFFVLFYFFLG
jgi:hypothetical protein